MNASPLTTTNATTQTLQAYTPRPHASGLVFITAIVTAQAANGDSAGYLVRGAAKAIAGTVSIVGSTSVVSFEDSGASSWSVTVDAADGAARLRVTGASSTTIVWQVERVELAGRRSGNEWAA
jgi:hypothetical protein